MKCRKCGKNMKYVKGMNQSEIDGWRCNCKEVYYDPDQAQRILLLNKIQREKYRLKLNKVRSNLILRIPKEVSDALQLQDGAEVEFYMKDRKMVINSNT